jgi:hypothetical protein
MLKYKEAPVWWYLVLLALSFFAGYAAVLPAPGLSDCFGSLIVVLKGQTTLPAWGYIVALLTGTIITVHFCVLPFVSSFQLSFKAFLYPLICSYGEWHRDEPTV